MKSYYKVALIQLLH